MASGMMAFKRSYWNGGFNHRFRNWAAELDKQSAGFRTRQPDGRSGDCNWINCVKSAVTDKAGRDSGTGANQINAAAAPTTATEIGWDSSRRWVGGANAWVVSRPRGWPISERHDRHAGANGRRDGPPAGDAIGPPSFEARPAYKNNGAGPCQDIRL